MQPSNGPQYTPNAQAEILTVSGDYFQFESLTDQRGMHIETIAHALALTNRFGGHTRKPYSVAQHSVLVSMECVPEDALWGLLHDASEAYLNDIVRPAKELLPDYKSLEQTVMDKICDYYGLGFKMPSSVHRADLVLCATEARDLMPTGHYMEWGLPHPPLETTIVPWSWDFARRQFLRRYSALTGEKVYPP